MTPKVIEKCITYKDFLKTEKRLKKLVMSKKVAVEKKGKLSDELLIQKSGNIEIYYCPFTATPDLKRLEKSKLVIIGITPGIKQANKAIEACQEGKSVAKKASFAGPMRTRLVKCLDTIGLNQKLALESCLELYETDKQLIFNTSLLKYPVLYKGKNYSGSESIYKNNEVLKKLFKLFTEPVIKNLGPDHIVIPLGKLANSILKNYNLKSKVLYDFPHPSPANHRLYKYLEPKIKDYRKILKIL